MENALECAVVELGKLFVENERVQREDYNPHRELPSQEFLDRLFQGGNAEYCISRLILHKPQERCPFGDGCNSRGWCCYREEILHKKMKTRYLVQYKLVEILKYLGAKNNQPFKDHDEAYMYWVDSGGAVTFSAAFDDNGIRDLDELARLCVHPLIDIKEGIRGKPKRMVSDNPEVKSS
jgi:hypothetical protein